MKLFSKRSKRKIIEETIINPHGRKSISFSELEEKGYSLHMLGYHPPTGEVMVYVNKKGVKENLAFGHTYVSQGSGVKISNVHATYECTGELSDIELKYSRGDTCRTHEQVERVIPLKRYLDEKCVQYRNDPPLAELRERLNEQTERLMAKL